MELNKIIQHNVLDQWPLPDKSVHCIVTSPPYWGQRDYNTAIWIGGDPQCKHKPADTKAKRGILSSTLKGGKNHTGHNLEGFKKICGRCGAQRIDDQIGLEETPELYIEKLMIVFKEAWRVLRDDGTMWINIGDTYYGGKGSNGASKAYKSYDTTINHKALLYTGPGDECPQDRPSKNLKPKDLVGIPWMLAFALRSAGWYLRQEIIWHKPNPMPESVIDRCTKAHESIFLFSKSRSYYFDNIAIQEPASYNTHERFSRAKLGSKSNPDDKKNGIRPRKLAELGKGIKNNSSFDAAIIEMPDVRNKRSVWSISPQAFPEAHFATFPEELPLYCIKAGLSEYGCCGNCGTPYKRIIYPSERYEKILGIGYHDHKNNSNGMKQVRDKNIQNKMRDAGISGPEYRTAGWESICNCQASIVPAIILDPFMGAGTTALVSRKLNRNFIGLELNPEYIKIAEARLKKQLGLFL